MSVEKCWIGRRRESTIRLYGMDAAPNSQNAGCAGFVNDEAPDKTATRFRGYPSSNMLLVKFNVRERTNLGNTVITNNKRGLSL